MAFEHPPAGYLNTHFPELRDELINNLGYTSRAPPGGFGNALGGIGAGAPDAGGFANPINNDVTMRANETDMADVLTAAKLSTPSGEVTVTSRGICKKWTCQERASYLAALAAKKCSDPCSQPKTVCRTVSRYRRRPYRRRLYSNMPMRRYRRTTYRRRRYGTRIKTGCGCK